MSFQSRFLLLLVVALISSLHGSGARKVVGVMSQSSSDLATVNSRSRHLTSASGACEIVKADHGLGEEPALHTWKKVIDTGLAVVGSAPVPGVGPAAKVIGFVVNVFYPTSKTASPSDIYDCMVAYVDEAVTKAVNNLENRLIQNDLDIITGLFKDIDNLLTEANKTNASNPFTLIQGKVTSLEGALNEAVNSLLSVEDNNKAANMMQLYMLVTAQLLPFATVVYDKYEAIFPNEAQDAATVFKKVSIVDKVNEIVTKLEAVFPKFKNAAVLQRTQQIQNTTYNKLCKGMEEDSDVMIAAVGGGKSGLCQFYDPGANSDGERCGMPAGFRFDNDLSNVYEADWKWKGADNGGDVLFTESRWIYGRDAARDALEMMKRNAETVAKINVAVATAGSGLWRAMLPGQVNRPKVTLKVVSQSTLPVGPAEFYCELGRTSPNCPLDKCSPQLSSNAYRTYRTLPLYASGGDTVKKTSVLSSDWAMVKATSKKAWSNVGNNVTNITKIVIASGSHIDGIKVVFPGKSDTLGSMNAQMKTIDTENGTNPIVRVDIYAGKNFHGISRITGLKFFQKNSPKNGIENGFLHGIDWGCGNHGSYGLGGSHHYEFDFTRWDGQVWLCGLEMFSTNNGTRVEAVAPRWCYHEFVVNKI